MNSLPKLAACNQWANERLLQRLEKIDPVPAKSLELLSHTMNAQIIWLTRIQGIYGTYSPFTPNNLEQCRHLHEETRSFN